MTNKRNKIKNLNVILPVTLIVTIGAALGAGEAKAEVKPHVVVTEDALIKEKKIYLNNVASIEGTESQKEKLGSIFLGLAPKPGRDKTFKGSWIESKIRSKRWLPSDIAIKIPEFVRISRKWQAIEEASLSDLFKGYIAKQINAEEGDFRVSRFKVTGNGRLPEGDIKVELVRNADGNLFGYVSLTAIVRVDGEIERRLALSGWVDRFEDVVCTSGSLKRNTIIAEDDISMQRRNISRLSHNVVTRADNVVGKRVKQSLKANAVILANMVEDPPLIRRGDRVTIVAESPTLLVTALGVAQTKGRLGDQVRVRSFVNRKEVIGRVVDSSTVRVEF
jgi:flagella basal body P-ring formation protein FlgA